MSAPAGPGACTVRLASRPEAAAQARRLVRNHVAALGLDDLVATAELLTSELVANAWRWTGGRWLELTVEAGRELVRISVSDCSRAHPVLILDQDCERTTGRGLALVDALASRWGVHPLPHGKTVWCELLIVAVESDLGPAREGTRAAARPAAWSTPGSGSGGQPAARSTPQTAYQAGAGLPRRVGSFC